MSSIDVVLTISCDPAIKEMPILMWCAGVAASIMKTRVLKNTELQRVPELHVPAEGLQVELTAKAASLFYHQGVIEVCCHGGPC